MVRSLPGGTVPLSAPYLGVLWGMFVKARLHQLWVQKFGITYRIASGEEDEERALAKGPLLMTVRMKGRTVTVGRVELGRCGEGRVPVEVMDLLGFAKVRLESFWEGMIRSMLVLRRVVWSSFFGSAFGDDDMLILW